MTSAPATSTHFRCEPYKTTLARNACATRFVEVRKSRNATTAQGHPTDVRIRFAKCIGCEVGAAHARGEIAGVEAAAPKIDALGREHRGVAGGDVATRLRWGKEGCPSCGRVPPPHLKTRTNAEFFRAFEHRCPHGEPCPSELYETMPRPPCCAKPNLEQESRPPSAPEMPSPVQPLSTPTTGLQVPRSRLVPEKAQPKERPMQTCAYCKNDFKAPGKRTYCSTKCRDEARAQDRPASARSSDELVDQAEQLAGQIKRERQTARAAKTARAPRARPPATSPASRSPTNGSAKPKLFAGPRELLELAGYSVEEVATPKGILLFVGVAS